MGDDDIGERLLAQAERDGVDVRHVVRRSHALSALIVEVLEAGPETLLTADDVRAAAGTIRDAHAVLVQLQQPAEATVAAAELGRAAGAMVVLDGAPGEEEQRPGGGLDRGGRRVHGRADRRPAAR